MESAPSAWLHYLACGALGMINGLVYIKSTQYFTDYEYKPVQAIAEVNAKQHRALMMMMMMLFEYMTL